MAIRHIVVVQMFNAPIANRLQQPLVETNNMSHITNNQTTHFLCHGIFQMDPNLKIAFVPLSNFKTSRRTVLLKGGFEFTRKCLETRLPTGISLEIGIDIVLVEFSQFFTHFSTFLSSTNINLCFYYIAFYRREREKRHLPNSFVLLVGVAFLWFSVPSTPAPALRAAEAERTYYAHLCSHSRF